MNKAYASLARMFLFLSILLVGPRGLCQLWPEDQKVIAPNRHDSDRFGASVSVSGDYAIIGAFNENYDENEMNNLQNAGAAYIYKRQANGSWLMVQKLVGNNNRQAGDRFGEAVDMDGDYAIVGAPGKNSPGRDRGAVFFYRKDSTGTWVDDGYEGANWELAQAGGSVAISGDKAMIGTARSNENSRYALVFSRINGSWTFLNRVIRSGSIHHNGPFPAYGTSLDVSGDTYIVGAYQDRIWNWPSTPIYPPPGVGAVFVYNQIHQYPNPPSFVASTRVNASDAMVGNQFGYSVAIESNFFVVGSPGDSRDEFGGNPLNSAGSAYIFRRYANGTVVELQKLVASDRDADDMFGYDVSISGSTIAVSAPYDEHDASGSNHMSRSGSVYIFKRGNGNVWVETEKITASDRGAYDKFGRSLQVQDKEILAGAYQEDEDTTGGNTIHNAGAAYLYSKCSQAASQTHSLCEGDTFFFYSHQITNGGQYQFTFSPAGACDSVIQLNISLVPTQFYDTATICQGESYLWQNQPLTQAGTYQESLLNSNGCDSILHLNLNVNPVYTIPDTQIICLGDSFLFGSQVLTQSGTFTEAYYTVNGCDSIINLDLTVIENDSGIVQTGYTLTSSDSLASYQWLSCDNAYSPVSGATDQSFRTTQNGSYAVALDRGGCRDTSDCIQISCSKDGFEPNDRASEASNLFGGALSAGQNMRLCPGGDEDWFYTQINTTSTLVVRLEDLSANYQLEVYTSSNSLVGSSVLQGISDEKVILHNIPPGMYYIRVYGENNSWHPDPYTLIANSILPSSQFGIGIKPIAQSSVVKSEKGFLLEVYPNPVEETLTIEFGEMQKEGRLSLYNHLGQQLKELSFSLKKTLELNMRGLPQGVYLLKIQTDEAEKELKVMRR